MKGSVPDSVPTLCSTTAAQLLHREDCSALPHVALPVPPQGEQTGARQGSGGEAGARAGAAPSHCHANRATGQVARGETEGAPGSPGESDAAA